VQREKKKEATSKKKKSTACGYLRRDEDRTVGLKKRGSSLHCKRRSPCLKEHCSAGGKGRRYFVRGKKKARIRRKEKKKRNTTTGK